MTCAEVMQPHPLAVASTLAVSVAAEIMAREGLTWLPVIDAASHHLIGTLTEHDIVARVIASGADAKATPVAEGLLAGPVVCRADEDVRVAAARMHAHQLSGLPVVDNSGRLVGVVDLSRLNSVQTATAHDVDGDPERLLG